MNGNGGGSDSGQKLDDHKLQKQLKLAYKKIKHTTELLRESEASSLRLADQAKLLKEEIRR
jgi:AmiR/NasT family two-component response regulator